MEFSHELIVPEEGFPFKLFLFEGSAGNYRRDKHWHRSVASLNFILTISCGI